MRLIDEFIEKKMNDKIVKDKYEKNSEELSTENISSNNLLNAALDQVGDDLAYIIGDTFIDFKAMSPSKQWRRIIRLLAEKGFLIRRI